MTSDEDKPVSSEETNSQSIANNMAAIFADQIRKGMIPWHVVPKSLRATVSELLNRGE